MNDGDDKEGDHANDEERPQQARPVRGFRGTVAALGDAVIEKAVMLTQHMVTACLALINVGTQPRMTAFGDGRGNLGKHPLNTIRHWGDAPPAQRALDALQRGAVEHESVRERLQRGLDERLAHRGGTEESPEGDSKVATGQAGKVEERVGDGRKQHDGHETVLLNVTEHILFGTFHQRVLLVVIHLEVSKLLARDRSSSSNEVRRQLPDGRAQAPQNARVRNLEHNVQDAHRDALLRVLWALERVLVVPHHRHPLARLEPDDAIREIHALAYGGSHHHTNNVWTQKQNECVQPGP
mmetsp:Transcript_27937/g.90158  ORF Transcript_27937/g.90158 Transcript_27937/m.90158 type:complete len:296 (+) Transcript_27937:905-1792(+)